MGLFDRWSILKQPFSYTLEDLQHCMIHRISLGKDLQYFMMHRNLIGGGETSVTLALYMSFIYLFKKKKRAYSFFMFLVFKHAFLR